MNLLSLFRRKPKPKPAAPPAIMFTASIHYGPHTFVATWRGSPVNVEALRALQRMFDKVMDEECCHK